MKTKLALLFFVLNPGNNFAQNLKKISLHFNALFNLKPICMDSTYFLGNNNDSIRIENVKFYSSSFELLYNGQTVWKERNSFHLITPLESRNDSVNLQIPVNLHYNELRFNLGIDSLTNTSGVMGGDLDPTLGMYWTWQSGYINTKIEGKSNLCTTRNKVFQFHLGGYAYPNSSLQKIALGIREQESPTIIIDLESFFKSINLSNVNQVMSPGKMSVILSKEFSKSFSTE